MYVVAYKGHNDVLVITKSRAIYYMTVLLISLSFTIDSSAQRPHGAIQLEKEPFSVEGNPAFVILPENVDRNRPVPWVWFAPTIDICPTENDNWMFERFLKNGVAIAGIDAGESYGSPTGTAIYSGLYLELVSNRNFAKKPCLLVRSRGGLMLYNWAIEHPESVAGVAGIFPVCDLRSYPGLKTAAPAYEMSEAQLDRFLTDHNPIDRIAVLAKAGVPIYHMHGDIDNLVPLRENSLELKKRYDAYGGNMVLELVKGQGHNYWPGWYTNQNLVDFIVANAKGNQKEDLKAASNDSGISVTDLQCEFQKEPLGIDDPNPRLSWKMKVPGNVRGVYQTAYQIIVKSAFPGNTDRLIWDSGKTESSESNGVAYQGPRLQSREQYIWRVKIWDGEDVASDWSEESIWGMGMINQDEWQGEWIKSDLELFDYQKELKKMPDHARDHTRNIWKRTAEIRRMTEDVEDAPAVWFRKEFVARKKLHRATVYVSGLGFYELYLNRQRVGDSYFHTTVYDYGKSVPYLVHDVTSKIRNSNNAMGVILGNGFFNPVIPGTLREYANDFINTPQLKCELKLEYTDGTVDYVVSDQSWKFTTDGPITFNSLRAGETYDARKELGDWSSYGYDDTSWTIAFKAPAPAGRLRNQTIPPMRVVDEIPTVAVKAFKKSPGAGNPHDNAPVLKDKSLKEGWLFDIGEQSAGWARLKIRGRRGQKITILYPGTNSHTLGRYQTCEYICKGGGEEFFEQRFSFNGYRHIYVYGLDYKPEPEDLVGLRVVSDFKTVGTFSCSDNKINKIQDVLLRTIKNYNTQMPQDPDREKSVWTQDVQSNFENAAYNFNLNTLYRKWQNDFVDHIQPDGYVPPVVPSAFDGPSINGPWWGGMVIFNPWQHYNFYGNADILKDSYEAMKAQFAYLTSIADHNIISWGLGDWQDIHSQEEGISNQVETSVPYSSTCAYYHFADIIQQTALILGNTADAKVYKQKMQEIRRDLYERFFDKETDIFDSGSQTSYVLALTLNIVYGGDKELLLQNFAQRIAKDDYHLSAGFVGMPFLLNLLKEEGLGDLAWKIATQETYPGWYDMVLNRGNTVLMEDWDAEYILPPRFVQMPSLAGSIGAYYYRSLGGIRPETPGYKNILIQPFTKTLDWVNCEYESPYGIIRSNWSNKNGILTMNISIPANSTATVYVPGTAITESGKAAEVAEGVRFFKYDDGYSIFRIESGDYSFRSSIK